MNSFAIAYLTATISISILYGIALGIEAGHEYVVMGAALIGITAAYASDPTTGRVLRYTSICLALALGIVIFLVVLEHIIDLSAYKGVIVLGIAFTELPIVAVASRYIVLFITIKRYRSYIAKIIKGLNNIKYTSHECNAITQYLREMVLGVRDSIAMYLREDHEYAIIRVVGAMEKFLQNLRSLGFLREESFVRMVKELLKKHNMDRDEVGKMLKSECTHMYSLRSKYAHGGIVGSASQEIKLEPYRLSQSLKQIEQILKYQLTVFESLVAIIYSCIFTYRAVEILMQYCPELKQLIESVSKREK